MQICRIQENRIDKALELVKEVFYEFDAPDYESMGIQTFLHFISKEQIITKIRSGEMVFWGCYDSGELVGVIAVRSKQHISLLFVRKEYHHQGIARKLFEVVKANCENLNLEKKVLTVNSAPYAVEFYKRIGFTPIQEEEIKDGIRYTGLAYYY